MGSHIRASAGVVSAATIIEHKQASHAHPILLYRLENIEAWLLQILRA